MAIKTIEYEISSAGITPVTEQFGGTQGDHNATKLNVCVVDELINSVTEYIGNGKAMYHFDVCDGQGGIWQSEPKVLEQNLSLSLEERHTRYGGKITVYLVITALSEDSQTEMELYSFPMLLRLKDRPEGAYLEGENYESVVGLVDVAKNNAEAANDSADEAEKQAKIAADEAKNATYEAQSAKTSAAEAEKTLKNINKAIADSTDQIYNAESENAQSGKAVAEALTNHYTKGEIDNLDGVKYVTYREDSEGDYVEIKSPRGELTLQMYTNGRFYINTAEEIDVDDCRISRLGPPLNKDDAATKGYVDELVGDIESLLGGI